MSTHTVLMYVFGYLAFTSAIRKTVAMQFHTEGPQGGNYVHIWPLLVVRTLGVCHMIGKPDYPSDQITAYMTLR